LSTRERWLAWSMLSIIELIVMDGCMDRQAVDGGAFFAL
jgi:hypothetical protein